MRFADALAIAALFVLIGGGAPAGAQTTATATLADAAPTTRSAVTEPTENTAATTAPQAMEELPPTSLLSLMNGAGETDGATTAPASDIPASLGSQLPPEGLPASLGQAPAAPPATGWNRQLALKMAGKLHPLTVHFPIALFLAAALAEFLSLFFPSRGLASSARFCLWLAAISAVVAAGLGWAAGAVGYFPGQEGDLFWHRWLGTATAAVAVLALFAGEVGRRPRRPGWLGFYRLLLVAGVCLIAVTGHLGASLVYGDGYFNLN